MNSYSVKLRYVTRSGTRRAMSMRVTASTIFYAARLATRAAYGRGRTRSIVALSITPL